MNLTIVSNVLKIHSFTFCIKHRNFTLNVLLAWHRTTIDHKFSPPNPLVMWVYRHLCLNTTTSKATLHLISVRFGLVLLEYVHFFLIEYSRAGGNYSRSNLCWYLKSIWLQGRWLWNGTSTKPVVSPFGAHSIPEKFLGKITLGGNLSANMVLRSPCTLRILKGSFVYE